MVMSRGELEAIVELGLSGYNHPAIQQLSPDEHFEKISAIYGEIVPGVPVREQMASMGATIAVLYWKLAQARGFVGVEENA